MADWKSYIEGHREDFLNDLIDFLRIPSVSTSPEHASDVRKAAEWTANRIRRAGIEKVEIMETGGHPVVFAERFESSDKPTVLFYGHFDVQPAEPLELWTHPPFEPHIEDGKIFARAASDMKGNVLLPIIACEALLQASGSLPVNVKFLIEGEEEIGSPSLASFIEQHKEKLTCDLTISADGGNGSSQEPQIGLSVRGLVGLEVRTQSANVDLHSGSGGASPNALHGLVYILDQLRDAEGRILVDGFYDDVAPISPEYQAIIDEMTPSLVDAQKAADIRASFGEPEFTPAQRMVSRPTLELNGVWGGFQGKGVKTVIPHEAFAKITCRLVANQNPFKVREQLKAYIEKVAPEYVKVSFEDFPGVAFPYQLPATHASVTTLTEILREHTGNDVKFHLGGGTVPIMGMLKEVLGAETITVGASGEGERAHAPDEFLRLENFNRAQEIFCKYLLALPGKNL